MPPDAAALEAATHAAAAELVQRRVTLTGGDTGATTGLLLPALLGTPTGLPLPLLGTPTGPPPTAAALEVATRAASAAAAELDPRTMLMHIKKEPPHGR